MKKSLVNKIYSLHNRPYYYIMDRYPVTAKRFIFEMEQAEKIDASIFFGIEYLDV